MVSNIVFFIALIFAMVNGAIFLVGKPTTDSWTEALLKTNGFLIAILSAGWMPWLLILGLGITNFKVVVGITALFWFGAIFGLPAYITRDIGSSHTLRR